MASVPPASFSLEARVQALLDVEVALAEALAAAGLIPATSVAPIRDAARATHYDVAALGAAAADAGNLLLPLLAAMRHRLAVVAPDAADHVHWGATSQDVIDTAMVRQARAAAAPILAALTRAADAAADLAARHAATPIAGRTWLQQATPTTFGAKAAGWALGLDRARGRLDVATDALGDLQLGGATGTLSAFGDAGTAVAAAMAARLGLRVPDLPWHTERSRVADLACALGLVCGALGKVGRDLTLLAQTEVAEVAEAAAPGRGGSSAMPHKRNPVAAVRAVAAALQAPGLVATMLAAMAQEHERAAGGWQAEWDTLPMLLALADDAAAALAEALPALAVDVARMRVNLDAAGGVARAEGLVAALAPRLGATSARTAVEHACRRAIADGRPLADVAAADPRIAAQLDAAAIAAAIDPVRLAAPAAARVRRALARRADLEDAPHG
jgi:3-carboxy-cis,cis-muconate cycloisomerase